MMTTNDILEHNARCAELTAGDGIPRLTWEQHGAAFAGPVVDLASGQQVAAYDSATPGTIGDRVDGPLYDVTFADDPVSLCRYPASQLRPWPISQHPEFAANICGTIIMHPAHDGITRQFAACPRAPARRAARAAPGSGPVNRDEIAALARGTVAVTLGALPFAALGWWVSWWLAGAVLVASAVASGWWSLRRLPARWMPW